MNYKTIYQKANNTGQQISKRQTELDEGLQQSLKEVREGKVIGPFDNAKDLMKSLSSNES